MDIGILGTGRMATGLAVAWRKAGHSVTLGSRDPDAAAGRTGIPAGIAVGPHARAAVARDVVVLATPFRATAELVAAHAAALAGKTILDITNPFGAAPAGVSGIEVHRRALNRPAHWAAAFKTNFARTIGAEVVPPRQCLIAADGPQARQAAEQLARDAGFDAVDCGDLTSALALDLMVPLMIALDRQHAGGAGASSWRFVPGHEG